MLSHLNLSINDNDLDFGSVELTLSPFDLNDITEGLNQTTIVTKLTQIIATLGVFICFFGIIGNILSIIVLNRKAMKKLSTYAYLLGLSVSDVISLIFTVNCGFLVIFCLPNNFYQILTIL